MSLRFKPIFPQGSLILVTGANSFIGSHVIDQLLSIGYHVRGTVRDTQKNSWLAELFEKKYKKGQFQLVHVAEFNNGENASEELKEAMKGASMATMNVRRRTWKGL